MDIKDIEKQIEKVIIGLGILVFLSLFPLVISLGLPLFCIGYMVITGFVLVVAPGQLFGYEPLDCFRLLGLGTLMTIPIYVFNLWLMEMGLSFEEAAWGWAELVIMNSYGVFM